MGEDFFLSDSDELLKMFGNTTLFITMFLGTVKSCALTASNAALHSCLSKDVFEIGLILNFMQQPSKRNRSGCAAVSVDVEFSVVVVISAHYLQGLKFGLFFMLRSQRKLRYCLTEEPLFTVNKIDTFHMAQTCYLGTSNRRNYSAWLAVFSLS